MKQFRLSRIASSTLVVFGVFVASLIGVCIYLAYNLAHSQDPGAPERAAAQIANFTVPKGFRATHGLDLPLIKQTMLVATDSAKPMTIILQGIYLSASKDEVDRNLAASIQSRCKKLLVLGDDLLTANGALFTLHRFSCVGAEGGTETYEYEMGTFTGKAPIATILAFAPQTAWRSAPVHALLKSLH